MAETIKIMRGNTYLNATITGISGKKRVLFLRDVRAALNWPVDSSPLYFSIWGQMIDLNKVGKNTLYLIHEHQDDQPTRGFKALIDKCREFKCSEVYVDVQKKYGQLMGLFNNIARYHNGGFIHLAPAAMASNFSFGLGLVMEWGKSLIMPKTAQVRQEMAGFTRDHLASSKPDANYPALNALRYLLSSLEQDPWPGQGQFKPGGRDPRADPGGWT